jgi:hypothetical protein
VQGTYNVTTSTTCNFPTFFDAAVTNPGATLTMTNGSVAFANPAPFSTGTLNLTGTGGITVAGPVTVNTLFNWSSGATGAGSGTLISNLTLAISGTNVHNFGGNLKNAGTATWSGASLGASSAFLDNTGSFTVNDDSDMTYNGGVFGVLRNTGTFVKAGGTGVTQLAAVLKNIGGTVAANVGTLRFNAGGTNAGRIGGAGTVDLGFVFETGIYESAVGSTINPANLIVSDNARLFSRGTFAASHTTVTSTATLHFFGPQSYAAASTLEQVGGEVIFDSDAGELPGPANLAVHASKGALTVNADQHLASLSLDGTANGVLGFFGNNAVTVSTGALSIGGTAQLDIDTNQLIVNYPTPGPSPMSSVRNAIVTGYNAAGTHWTGPGGIVSTNAKDDAQKAIGYAEAAEVFGISGAQTASWLSNTVDATAVLLRFTISGDATLDGAVDFNDLVKLAQNYNTTVSAATDSWWIHGDFTYDGIVDFNDLVALAQNYNTLLLPAAPIPGAPAGFSDDLAAAFAGVPEPCTLAVVAVFGMAGAPSQRRRRRRASRSR